jgi:hypothetical protein
MKPILKIFINAVVAAARIPQLGSAVYVCNLLMAAVIAAAFRAFVAGTDSVSSLAPLFTDFDATLASDFLNRHGEAIGALARAVVPLALLSLAVNVILTGGILSLLSSRQKFSLRGFLRGCGHFAGRFLRVFFLVCLLLAAVGGIMITIFAGLDALLSSPVTAETRGNLIAAIGILATGFMLVVVVMVGDYARVLTVVDDGRSMLKALWSSFRFILRSAAGAFGVQYLFLLVNIGLFLLYLSAEWHTGTGSGFLLGFLFVVQQLVMIARAFLRTALFAGEVELAALSAAERLEAVAPAAAGT